jgi:GR25 family glycosyltransferase involved in LPS biosynthesis
MKINDFFGENIYYINIDERKDRRSLFEVEQQKLGITAKRFSAITPKCSFSMPLNEQQIKWANGVMGCILSHRGVLELAKKENKHLMVLEDDVFFLRENPLENIELALDELPEDFSLFYLGGNICGKMTRVSDHILRLSHSQSTHGYCVNKNFIDKLLEIIPVNQVVPLDLIYTQLVIPNYPCYIIYPLTAIQRASYSSIENQYVDYGWMQGRYDQNLNES